MLSRLIQRCDDFPVLVRAARPGDVTVLHVRGAAELASYERRGREWAASVWGSWAEHHSVIREALRLSRGDARL
jgi:hypothetical protein